MSKVIGGLVEIRFAQTELLITPQIPILKFEIKLDQNFCVEKIYHVNLKVKLS